MPTGWFGLWYQRGMDSLLEIADDRIETKGLCVDALPSHQYYLFLDQQATENNFAVACAFILISFGLDSIDVRDVWFSSNDIRIYFSIAKVGFDHCENVDLLVIQVNAMIQTIY